MADDVPPSFICPLTLEIMKDPVTAADGHSYEASAIKKWLQSSDLSPLTGNLLPNKHLTRSHALRNAIEEFQVAQRKKSTQPSSWSQQRLPISQVGVKVILLGDSNGLYALERTYDLLPACNAGALVPSSLLSWKDFTPSPNQRGVVLRRRRSAYHCRPCLEHKSASS